MSICICGWNDFVSAIEFIGWEAIGCQTNSLRSEDLTGFFLPPDYYYKSVSERRQLPLFSAVVVVALVVFQ